MPPLAGRVSPQYKGNYISDSNKPSASTRREFKADIDVLKRFGDRLESDPRPNKTNLATAVDIRWDRFLAYFNHLLGHGLIEPTDEDESGSEVFRKTSKGRELFNMVERLHDLLKQHKPVAISSAMVMMISAVWIAVMHI